MPCVNEYFATVNLKLKDYDKSIEYAEKDLAQNYQDLNLLLTLMRAYAASTKVSDTIFDVINKVPDQAKSGDRQSRAPCQGQPTRSGTRSRRIARNWPRTATTTPCGRSSRSCRASPIRQSRFNCSTPSSRRYPEVEKDNAAQVNTFYFQAYQKQGNLDKTVEYGDKVIAADPNNVAVLNTMGLITAFYLPHPSPDKAAAYAQKALAAAQGLKKPDGVDDAAFKKQQDTQLGMANLTLGYAALLKGQKTAKYAPAIANLKLASSLLGDNPALQGQAFYFLGNAYELVYPANHRAALDALNKAVDLPGPMQGQARTLQAKVKAAVK